MSEPTNCPMCLKAAHPELTTTELVAIGATTMCQNHKTIAAVIDGTRLTYDERGKASGHWPASVIAVARREGAEQALQDAANEIQFMRVARLQRETSDWWRGADDAEHIILSRLPSTPEPDTSKEGDNQ